MLQADSFAISPQPVCDLVELSAEQFYRLEITQEIQRIGYPLRTPLDTRHSYERQLVERARAGDQQARQDIITALQPVVLKFVMKFCIEHSWERSRLERLDLVEHANLEMIEQLDIALTKDNPFATLTVVARAAIRRHYKQYGGSLITTPLTLEASPYHIESLDAPLSSEDDAQTLLDTIACRSLEPGQIEETPDFSALYEAINQLSESQRTVIAHHYGLFDHAPEPLCGIDRTFGWKIGRSNRLDKRALQRLYSRLEATYHHYANESGSGVRPGRQLRTKTSVFLTESQLQRLDHAAARIQARGEQLTIEALRKEARMGPDLVKAYIIRRREVDPPPTPEQRLDRAYAELQARGEKITGRALAALAHVQADTVYPYLKRRREVDPPPTPEQRLDQAVAELQARGEKITAKSLKALTGIGERIIFPYLRRRREADPPLTREQRLDQVYAELQARGEKITGEVLAALAHTDRSFAYSYLKRRRETDPPPTPEQRLDQAYAELQARGEKITVRKLRALTGIGEQLVRPYLRRRREADPPPTREQRLDQAAARLQAQGRRLTIEALQKEAHVRRDFVKAYLFNFSFQSQTGSAEPATDVLA